MLRTMLHELPAMQNVCMRWAQKTALENDNIDAPLLTKPELFSNLPIWALLFPVPPVHKRTSLSPFLNRIVYRAPR
jgi:hypothetical protein